MRFPNTVLVALYARHVTIEFKYEVHHGTAYQQIRFFIVIVERTTKFRKGRQNEVLRKLEHRAPTRIVLVFIR